MPKKDGGMRVIWKVATGFFSKSYQSIGLIVKITSEIMQNKKPPVSRWFIIKERNVSALVNFFVLSHWNKSEMLRRNRF